MFGTELDYFIFPFQSFFFFWFSIFFVDLSVSKQTIECFIYIPSRIKKSNKVPHPIIFWIFRTSFLPITYIKLFLTKGNSSSFTLKSKGFNIKDQKDCLPCFKIPIILTRITTKRCSWWPGMFKFVCQMRIKKIQV